MSIAGINVNAFMVDLTDLLERGVSALERIADALEQEDEPEGEPQ